MVLTDTRLRANSVNSNSKAAVNETPNNKKGNNFMKVAKTTTLLGGTAALGYAGYKVWQQIPSMPTLPSAGDVGRAYTLGVGSQFVNHNARYSDVENAQRAIANQTRVGVWEGLRDTSPSSAGTATQVWSSLFDSSTPSPAPSFTPVANTFQSGGTSWTNDFSYNFT